MDRPSAVLCVGGTDFERIYSLNYRFSSTGIMCRAAFGNRAAPEGLKPDARAMPAAAQRCALSLVSDFLPAPFAELAQKIADDFNLRFVTHRLTADY